MLMLIFGTLCCILQYFLFSTRNVVRLVSEKTTFLMSKSKSRFCIRNILRLVSKMTTFLMSKSKSRFGIRDILRLIS